MNLAISNIAWSKEDDKIVQPFLQKNGFSGMEIAPTRVFQEDPYNYLDKAILFAQKLKEDYNLSIVSIQSIWYGKTENIFNSTQEREILYSYTKKAIDFAVSMGCDNIVFGCPKNRIIIDKNQYEVAIDFFSRLSEYAHANDVIIAIEANPEIYNTNFLTTTSEVLNFVRDVNMPGLAVNYDLGTVIYNKERLITAKDMKYVNHIHISEPFLNKISIREIHKKLRLLINDSNYKKYVSIEMKNLNDTDVVKKCVIDTFNLFK
ncbi:sugar phosphate isomerase/epimerase family protein [Pectinatus haikarae]|uniref:sugar phosphate isomerase/epimerase family protein n=1 Tax=Pectinatus haikarae TaxID=349096 RepID=UPI0018C81F27|nr:sugar phosphate isomerase/epimerase family protein [Pectinatus haikarae]